MPLENHNSLAIPLAKESPPGINVRTHIYFSRPTREAVRELAFASGESFSGMIELLVIEALAARAFKPKRDWLIVTSQRHLPQRQKRSKRKK